MDCGPTCLKMIGEYYGKKLSIKTLKEESYLNRNGVTMLGISDAAESLGFNTLGIVITLKQLIEEVPLPCIVHWKRDHFLVVYKITKRRTGPIIHVADPARGKVKFKSQEFLNGWISVIKNNQHKGHCLILEPTQIFYERQDEVTKGNIIKSLFLYGKMYKGLMFQLLLGFFLTSIFSLVIPFLTQAIVDFGINFKNTSFLFLILLAQFALTIGTASIGLIRGWIILQLSTRLNVSLITTFLVKLMRLPLSFFQSKKTGDLIQRINDNNRIQNFLTSTSVTIFFSAINFTVFSIVIAIYDVRVFLCFILGSTFYVFWIRAFLKYRREIDVRKFTQLANNQNSLIQLMVGIQDIKLYNSEKTRRWEWEKIQALLFKLSAKGLLIGQYQIAGATVINGLKNFLVTYLTAKAVIDGEMTLGMMMSIQFIIGQLNGPIESLNDFIQSYQDAKISFERLDEIEQIEPENRYASPEILSIPSSSSIILRDLTFRYNGPRSPAVLNKINLEIKANEVTAIVGASGSGKTTLLKMIMGNYDPSVGGVQIGDLPLNSIHKSLWRNHIGTVMQDGFLFSDTIANNIAMGGGQIDESKLLQAVEVANIREFIEELPSNYNTIIGTQGDGVSQGQRQRILIARAVYKNPKFIFFDEATNALDSNNEREIIENLNSFFISKTVVIVAHRLSTVMNANQIIVMDKGSIVEQGSHSELVKAKSYYYNLVKNQLELSE